MWAPLLLQSLPLTPQRSQVAPGERFTLPTPAGATLTPSRAKPDKAEGGAFDGWAVFQCLFPPSAGGGWLT